MSAPCEGIAFLWRDPAAARELLEDQAEQAMPLDEPWGETPFSRRQVLEAAEGCIRDFEEARTRLQRSA